MAGEAGQETRWRRRSGVELRVIPSSREGERFVLEDVTHGRCVELRAGARDAYVWERLDGTRTLHEIALAFLGEHGSLPRDLAGFVARLAQEGVLEGGAAAPLPRPVLAKLALRVPIPGLDAILSALAAPLVPFARVPVGVLALLAGAAGLALTLTEHPLARAQGTLLVLDGSPWRGVVAFLGLSFVISLLESLARAALLRRGGAVREAGLALPLGLPSLYVGEAPALLLPAELRVLVHLAPLLVSLVIGGAASWAVFELARRGGHGSARHLALLAKVAWAGYLRALFHANPLGPSGVERAIATWSHVDELARATWRFVTHEVFALGERGLAAREQLLVVHGALSVAWLVGAARVLARLELGEVVPHLRAAVAARDALDALALLVPLVLASVPFVLVVVALVVALGRALLRALDRSPVLGSPAGAASLAAALGLLLAFETAQLAPDVAAAHAALAGAVVLLLAFATANRDGQGLTGVAIAGVAAATTFEVFGVLFLTDARGETEAAARLALVLSYLGAAAPLLLVVSAFLELATTTRYAVPCALLGTLTAVAGSALLLVRGLEDFRATLDGGPGEGAPPYVAPVLAVLAASIFFASQARSRGSLRAASRGYFAFGALALAAAKAPGLLALAGFPIPRGLPGVETALLVLGLGLLGAALVARSREEAARRYSVPVVLGDDHTTKGILQRVLASVAITADGHLGRGASAAFEANTAPAPGDAEQLARRAVRAGELIAGQTWLARALEGALARIPCGERARVGQVLAFVPALAEAGEWAQDAALPDAETRFALFRSVPILGPLSDDEARALAYLCVRERFAAGETVIQQGEMGERFYVIGRGEAEVAVLGKDGRERTVATLGPGDGFGEGALLKHEPRSATVRATANMDLLVLGRDAFLEFVRTRPALVEKLLDRLDDVAMVRAMGIFSELDGSQVSHLFQRFKLVLAGEGDAIVKEGEKGDRFYVVREGSLDVEKLEDGAPKPVQELGRGDYFGELALLHDAPRAATVRARTAVSLLALERDDFLASFQGRARARLVEASRAQLEGGARRASGGAA
jgi:CRP-like cAMP-binding protein